MTTPVIGLPELAAQQSQPEVTLNTSLILLQALLTGAEAVGRNDPPSQPEDGQVFIVGTSPTGEWQDHANAVAIYYDGWKFVPDRESDGAPIEMGESHAGLHMFVKGSPNPYLWDGEAWVSQISSTVPSSSSDDGKEGQLAYDDDYLYVCTADDQWARASLSSF